MKREIHLDQSLARVNSAKNLGFLTLFIDCMVTFATKRLLLLAVLLQTAHNCLVGLEMGMWECGSVGMCLKREFDFGILEVAMRRFINLQRLHRPHQHQHEYHQNQQQSQYQQ